ncbi:MAG: hypothetical protein WBV60_05820 [Terriglobales bacterium]
MRPAIEFQSADITGKSLLQAPSLLQLTLADGRVSLTGAGTDAASSDVIRYLRDHPGAASPLYAVASRSSANLSKTLLATCSVTDHYWNGDIQVTGAYAVGTQSQKQIGGAWMTSYARNPYFYSWNNQVAVLDLEAKYTEALKQGAPAIKSQEYYFGSLNYSFHPSLRWSPFGVARLYHNYSLGLALGQVYGGGIEYKLNNLTLSGALVGITDRLYAPAAPFSSVGARAYESYSMPISLGKVKVIWFEGVEVIPAFQLAKAVQGRALTQFNIPLTPRVQLVPKFGDDYLGDAPPKHRLNYSNTSLSLDFKIGRTQ